MLSLKKLLMVFTAACISFFFLFLPASLVLNWAGVDQILKYRSVEGNLWQMHVRGASVRGFYLGDIEYTPGLGVASGALEGHIIYRGAGRTAAFDFQLERNSVLQLADMQIDVPVRVADIPLPVSGILKAQASVFSYDLKEGCLAGTLSLESDMLAVAFEKTPWAAPVLEGNAECDAGVLKARLRGENDMMAVELDAFWQGGPYMAATLRFLPGKAAQGGAQFQNMMQLAGLVKHGNAWQKQLTIRF